MSRMKHVVMHLREMRAALRLTGETQRYWLAFHWRGAVCAALHGEVRRWPKADA